MDPDMVPSSQVVNLNHEPALSKINARRMWKAWQRSFRSPEVALLDLIDNAVDATLSDRFEGKIQIYHDPLLDNQTQAQGICLRNNCTRRIPPLSKVLEVFGSRKGEHDIGENGVGIKQACAVLTNLSFIITKNDKTYLELGILWQDLQTEDCCLIPAFTFGQATLWEDLEETVDASTDFRNAAQHYGADVDPEVGLVRLYNHMQALMEWPEERAFLVVLHRVIHRGSSEGIQGILQTLKELIPKTYLHLTAQVSVEGRNLDFHYWGKRLAELHKFQLKIDSKHSFDVAEDWHMPNNGHLVTIYLGFDPFRAHEENNNKASLFIYSRKAGRLVKTFDDARVLLGLSSGGTDFGQGLTVILDDHEGKLPLDPTKQDISFAFEAFGKVHEKNLYSWIGGFAHFYYQWFLDIFTQKTALREEVLHQKDALKKLKVVAFLGNGSFSTFRGLSFHRKSGRIRCCNRKKGAKWVAGPDTKVSFRKVASVGRKKSKEKKKSVRPKKRKKEESHESHEDLTDESKEERRVPAKKAKRKIDLLDSDDDEDYFKKNTDESFEFRLKLKEKALQDALRETRVLKSQLAKKSLENSAPLASTQSDDAIQIKLEEMAAENERLKKEVKMQRNMYHEEMAAEIEHLKKKVEMQRSMYNSLKMAHEDLMRMNGL
jgi:hypothetical protein